jgi:hypothetical protein
MLDADRLIIPSDERKAPAPKPAVDELLACTPSHGAYGATPRHRPVRQPLDENSPPPALLNPEPDLSNYLD